VWYYRFCTANNNENNIFGDGARNVTFDENTNEQRTSSRAVDKTLALYEHDEQISKFFARPVLLYERDWTGSTLEANLHVWQGWTQHKRVANRLANYFGFRGNLKVKIVTNGNPFYYGRMMVSYYPLYGFFGSTFDDLTYGSNQFGRAIIESQRQHINLCPSISSGAEMTLPWVYHGDYIPIPGDVQHDHLGDVSYNLGALKLRILVPVTTLMNTAGAASPKITLRVYAWMDDIELFGNTQRVQPGIEPQADSSLVEEQQAQKGAVSSALTAVAGAAHMLSSVPQIAPYAKPAEVAASTGARIAQLLGFSRPVNYVEPSRMQPSATNDVTHVVGADNPIVLSLDPAATTTVDPLALGVDRDEMSFKSICGRYSLFNECTWDITYAPGSIIQSFPVHPHVCPSLPTAVASRFYPTAVGGVANLFTYWKGSMVYRFDVISTSFHRGRILVVYDPGGTTEDPEESVQYAALVDITESRSFEVEVKYNYFNGLKRIDMTEDGAGFYGALNALEAYNGVLTLYVGTGLEVPNYVSTSTPSDVTILGYVKGGDDLCFGYPRIQFNGAVSRPRPNFQSEADEQLTSCCDLDTTRVLSVGFKSGEGSDLLYLGENIDSLRTLCKRYQTYIIDKATGVVTDDMLVSFTYGAYPAVWGQPCDAGDTSTVTGTALNEVGFTYIAYTQMAFVAKRGAIRWKFVPVKGSALASRPCDAHGIVAVRRGYELPGTSTIGGRAVDAYGTAAALANFYDFSPGAALSPMSVNPTLSWEMPYQNPAKFINGRSNDGATTKTSNGVRDYFRLNGDSRSFPERFALLCAAGEDFQCMYFVGWPPYVHTASVA